MLLSEFRLLLGSCCYYDPDVVNVPSAPGVPPLLTSLLSIYSIAGFSAVVGVLLLLTSHLFMECSPYCSVPYVVGVSPLAGIPGVLAFMLLFAFSCCWVLLFLTFLHQKTVTMIGIFIFRIVRFIMISLPLFPFIASFHFILRF